MRHLFKIFGEADTNGDGQLDMAEFSGWMTSLDARKMGMEELRVYVKTLYDDYDHRRRAILLRKLLMMRAKGVDSAGRQKQLALISSKLGFSAFLYILCTFCTHSERKLIDFEYDVFAGGMGQKLKMEDFRSMCERMEKMKHFEPALERFEFEFGTEGSTPITRQGFQKVAKGVPFLLWPVKNLQDIMRERSLGFETWGSIKKAALLQEKTRKKRMLAMTKLREGGGDDYMQDMSAEGQARKAYMNDDARAGISSQAKMKKLEAIKECDLNRMAAIQLRKNRELYDAAEQYGTESSWNKELKLSVSSLEWRPKKNDVKKGQAFMGMKDDDLKTQFTMTMGITKKKRIMTRRQILLDNSESDMLGIEGPPSEGTDTKHLGIESGETGGGTLAITNGEEKIAEKLLALEMKKPPPRLSRDKKDSRKMLTRKSNSTNSKKILQVESAEQVDRTKRIVGLLSRTKQVDLDDDIANDSD